MFPKIIARHELNAGKLSTNSSGYKKRHSVSSSLQRKAHSGKTQKFGFKSKSIVTWPSTKKLQSPVQVPGIATQHHWGRHLDVHRTGSNVNNGKDLGKFLHQQRERLLEIKTKIPAWPPGTFVAARRAKERCPHRQEGWWWLEDSPLRPWKPR